MNREDKLREKRGNYIFGLLFGLLLILFFIYEVVLGNWIELFSAGKWGKGVTPMLGMPLGLIIVYYSLRGLLKTRNREKLYKENKTNPVNYKSKKE